MKDVVKIHYPKQTKKPDDTAQQQTAAKPAESTEPKQAKEYGGRKPSDGLEPTRYGDWEFKGRCIDF